MCTGVYLSRDAYLQAKHYAVWNDTLLTYPPGSYHEVRICFYSYCINLELSQHVVFGDDFHGSSIPVDGQSVAQVVRERCIN